MKKLIIPFILLFSFNSFANSYDCDLPPFNEDKSDVDTEKCVTNCQGNYVTSGSLVWTCSDVGRSSSEIARIVEAYEPNALLVRHCSITGSTDSLVAVRATVVLYHDEPNLEDECKGYCSKNSGSLGEPTTIESYPTSDDISNGFVSISNGSTYKCNKDDSSSDDACVVRTVAQQSFDGSKITTITQSFLTENQCTGNDGNIDLDTENISLEYCNELGGYYGNQYCDNSDPDYHCHEGDCKPISGGVCENDGDCNNPDPEPDPDPTLPDTGGGDTGGGSGENPDGSDTGETPDGSLPDLETEEGLIAYLDSLLAQFGYGTAQANSKYGNEKIQNKKELQNNSNVVDFSSTSLDESGFISGESCPPPYKLELPFGVFEIPFDFICNFASTISFIVMGLAYVVSARILIGGI
ncbi:virulence factor TspB C-terminal domain-related protein [Vibrio bivalvicida]|uniref:Virulence factor TspB C-terminal domain-related protein n=1 Tax=Vibrio bivalvicida TaxID=1276888 RepID=A0ABV4MMQ8_9VIBR